MNNNTSFETAVNTHIAKLNAEHDKHESDISNLLLEQHKLVADMVRGVESDVAGYITSVIDEMKNNGELLNIIRSSVANEVGVALAKVGHLVSVKEFGAMGNGLNDDSDCIQEAINYANTMGRQVLIPAGEYRITKPIVLNGCTLNGEVGNAYECKGTILRCSSKDFIAVRQGSTSKCDTMFNIRDIVVADADIAFEIVYALNSHFTNLYAIDCNTGFNIGDKSAVGCMFCNFENLYTLDCDYGIKVESNEYFNNNRFINGFISGNIASMTVTVNGGYGAVGNTFNNVEFRSTSGRGIILTSCLNTNFNSCYFECGGNAIRMTNFCSIDVSNCTYGMFNPTNRFGDNNVIIAEDGANVTIDNGVIFLTSDYRNVKFLHSDNVATYDNVVVLRNIIKNGDADDFEFFDRAVKTLVYAKQEQVATTGTVNVPGNERIEVSFEYPVEFDSTPSILTVTMRGASGTESGVFYTVSERTNKGGVISISNNTTTTRSISFSVYARMV